MIKFFFIVSQTILKVDIPANRYDLLCMEGLTRAINTFNGATPVRYTLATQPEADLQKIIVSESVKDIRPIVMGAVLRNVTFTQEMFNLLGTFRQTLH